MALPPPLAVARCRAISCAFAIVLFVLPLPAQAQDDRCGTGRDFMVQALEQIKTGTDAEVEDGLQLLEHSVQTCPSYGDGWYYRSLFEQKLGRTAKSTYSLSKAKLFGSDAMKEGVNPFVLAAPELPRETSLPPLGQKWALVIGISQFHDARLNLRYTSKDARDLAATLTDPRYGRFPAANVRTLADAEVTTRSIKENLNWLARNAQENDLVLIFVATHGTARSDDNADVNYIVASDTDRQTQDSLFATSMAMVELSDVVRTRIKARRTVIVLDTCHSGAATGSLKDRATGLTDSTPSSAAIERIRQGVGRAILTSSQEDQVSYEGPPFENGYFTHFLIEALHQNNGNSTVEQLFSYVNDKLPKAVAARKQTARGFEADDSATGAPLQQATQVPKLSSSELGSGIVLGAPPAVSSAAGEAALLGQHP